MYSDTKHCWPNTLGGETCYYDYGDAAEYLYDDT